MMPPPNNDDTLLEARLRRDLPPLPDEGFANRVLAALPPPVRQRRPRSRLVFVLAGALAGTAWALAAGAGRPGPDLDATATALTHALTPLADPMLLLALAVAGLSLVYAFRRGTLHSG